MFLSNTCLTFIVFSLYSRTAFYFVLFLIIRINYSRMLAVITVLALNEFNELRDRLDVQ